ncbi:unnamed protein product [Trichobilharzia szidati]|nr:unnamed protein product [Trichobilharzia szidati]
MSHHLQHQMQSQLLTTPLTDRSNTIVTQSLDTDIIMGNTMPSSFLEMNLSSTTNGLSNDIEANRSTRNSLTDDSNSNNNSSQCKSPLWLPPVTPYTLLGLLKPHLTQSGLLPNPNHPSQPVAPPAPPAPPPPNAFPIAPSAQHNSMQQTNPGTTMLSTKLCEDSIMGQQSNLKSSQHHISSMSSTYLSELLNHQSQTNCGKNSVHGKFKTIDSLMLICNGLHFFSTVVI